MNDIRCTVFVFSMHLHVNQIRLWVFKFELKQGLQIIFIDFHVLIQVLCGISLYHNFISNFHLFSLEMFSYFAFIMVPSTQCNLLSSEGGYSCYICTC